MVELTGDAQPDIALLNSADILCTTPEKWGQAVPEPPSKPRWRWAVWDWLPSHLICTSIGGCPR